MSILMKRTLAVIATIILGILALYFVTDKYLQTHYLILTNQSQKSVCVQSDYFESKTVLPSENKKIEFRVTGDGSFTLTNCDGMGPIQRTGYFTINHPRCHLVEYVDKSKISYETATVKTCK